MDARSSIRWEIEVAMELQTKITYELGFVVLYMMYHTFAVFGVIGLNGSVFQFSDNLQSGLPDQRDEFIKG
jgi:hypothetical protein